MAMVRPATGQRMRATHGGSKPGSSYGWTLLPCALLLLISLRISAAVLPSEYRIKAVFLFNFAQFVEWPPDTFKGPGQPFVIGILGQDPFDGEIDAAVRGETVAQHPMVVERYDSVANLPNCNILYIARSEMTHLPQILAALRGRSILTVSDADNLDQSGVMIRLLNRSNRIRMQIDVSAAKASRLTISSKLLRPAEIVGAAEG